MYRCSSNGCNISSHETEHRTGIWKASGENAKHSQVYTNFLFHISFFYLFLFVLKILFLCSCELIAVGNGTACRETELWLTKLFECGILDSNKIRYCIVSEQGASIYSCGDVAKKEFPNLDVNIISAGKYI